MNTDPAVMFGLGIFIGGVASGVGALLAVWAVKRQQAKQLRPIVDRASASAGAADDALTELRRARDVGEFNTDEEIIFDRMERLHASRPRPEGP